MDLPLVAQYLRLSLAVEEFATKKFLPESGVEDFALSIPLG